MKTLITGASSGIGYELAKIMSNEGHELILVARRKDRLEELKKQLKTKTKIIQMDLSDIKNAEKLYSLLKKENVEILVNNAGFGLNGKFIETDMAAEMEMIDLNVKTLVILSKLFSKDMVKKGSGKIMNVASVAGFIPGPYMNIYYSTKAFVLSFSEALAEELSGSGVTVTVLCPGMTKTEFDKVAKIKNGMFKYGMSAEKVAMLGYKAMMKGKRIEITGCMNKLSVCLRKFVPRCLMTRIVAKIQSV
ncbi:MAG: SDR family oxidoreductase [Candidatus Woesearchaeota archaeon]|nr:SDR family oxidoreductase [Candidatus Woesearchaeota archaeon]